MTKTRFPRGPIIQFYLTRFIDNEKEKKKEEKEGTGERNPFEETRRGGKLLRQVMGKREHNK